MHLLNVVYSVFALSSLSSAITWYMGGNFAMAPKQFKQVFVVRIVLGHVSVSVAYDLLPSKHSSAYREMFWALRTVCFDQQLVPAVQNFVTDCEKGILKAVNAIFCEHNNYADASFISSR